MRRKTKSALAITFMGVVMVSAFSYLYISQLLRQRLNAASDIAQLLAQQIVDSASNAVCHVSSAKVDTDNSSPVLKPMEGYLATDPAPAARSGIFRRGHPSIPPPRGIHFAPGSRSPRRDQPQPR